MLRTMRMAALAVAIMLAFSGLALARDDDDNQNRGGTKAHDRNHDRDRHDRDHDKDRDSDRDRDRDGHRWRDRDRNRDAWRRTHPGPYWGYGNRGRSDGARDRDDGFFNHDRNVYGRSGYVRNPGFNYGYQDGALVARNDMREGKRFNSNPRGKYDDRDGVYRREYGDKNGYKVEYGNGYREGYEAAYRRY
jgi:hypothetical protein